jgi:hypothetical protein
MPKTPEQKQNVLLAIQKFARTHTLLNDYSKHRIIVNSNREPLKVVFTPHDTTAYETSYPVKMIARKGYKTGMYKEEYKTVKVECSKDHVVVVKCSK